jgi:hypothetical protein
MVLVPDNTHVVARINTGYGATGQITVQNGHCDVCHKDAIILECDSGGLEQALSICEPCTTVAFQRQKLKTSVREANERALEIGGRE